MGSFAILHVPIYPRSCLLISDMVKVTKVLARTALDVCNRE